jgi:hypothetical protein
MRSRTMAKDDGTALPAGAREEHITMIHRAGIVVLSWQEIEGVPE